MSEGNGTIERHLNPDDNQYVVTFTSQEDEDAELNVTTFITTTEKDTKSVILALSVFSSGDIQTCLINGEIAVLDRDWGLE